jgi:hypothetical protein
MENITILLKDLNIKAYLNDIDLAIFNSYLNKKNIFTVALGTGVSLFIIYLG